MNGFLIVEKSTNVICKVKIWSKCALVIFWSLLLRQIKLTLICLCIRVVSGWLKFVFDGIWVVSSESDLFLVVLSGLGSDQLDILSSVVVLI